MQCDIVTELSIIFYYTLTIITNKEDKHMSVINITTENFESEVMQSDKPVLIDFWASWCGPCQMVLPIIAELGEELTDVKVCKINVDEYPNLAKKFRVLSIPTLVVMENGEIAQRSVGAKSKEEILELLK